ncbi:hypothetical protein DF3PB_730008 [uncultured Defluviicoccus sp.]|uniref:Uncharacterized protein n=1 Tax=metagenome TaxID=256318 RepID=A0A380TLE2_9ZZZZ|nr:hypothetical protein DF3PB_730008 [uncultured Defluviicoccus sp.]
MHWHKQSVHPVCAESARDSICCAATTLLGRESPDWVAAPAAHVHLTEFLIALRLSKNYYHF